MNRATRRANGERGSMNNQINQQAVPDLSLIGKKVKLAAGAPGVIITHLDPDGTFECDVVGTPQGPQPQMRRDQYMTAEELIAAVRAAVREELSALYEDRAVMVARVTGKDSA